MTALAPILQAYFTDRPGYIARVDAFLRSALG